MSKLAHPNPAIAALIEAKKRNSPRLNAERETWLDTNSPPPVYGPKLCSREYEYKHRQHLELHRFVWEALRHDFSFHPKPRTNWRDYAPEVVTKHAAQSLSYLCQLAGAKDAVAIEAYASLIQNHVAILNSLIETHGEFLVPIARKSTAWPIRAAKRKPFGDDTDKIIGRLQVGKETIAGDPNARFNPRSKFGAIAFNLLERIERRRNEPPFVSAWRPAAWLAPAKALPPFTTKPSGEDKRKWLAVIEQLLEDDFRDPEKTRSYLSCLDKPAYKRRKKAVFFDKVRNEFETLWGSRRQPKR